MIINMIWINHIIHYNTHYYYMISIDFRYSHVIFVAATPPLI
jgi:hypothetical protein